METGRLIPIASAVWEHLRSSIPEGDLLYVRYAAPGLCDRLFAALDAHSRRHFLIQLHDEEKDFTDKQSSGINADSYQLQAHGLNVQRYLDLVCLDVNGHGIFDLIGGEIAQRLSAGGEPAPNVVAGVLSKWRRFWGHLPQDTLSKEAQLGLFGELWFLSVWMASHVGMVEAVKRWRGPKGSRHDFEWSGRSVEVKTCASTRGRIHKVSGLDQLSPPQDGQLLFFSLRVREEGGATNSLPAAIRLIESALEGHEKEYIHFQMLLSCTGYSSSHDDVYSDVTWRIVEEGLYEVRDDFPRVTVCSFAQGLPCGVEKVNYDINLSVCQNLLLALSPEMLDRKWFNG